MFCFLLKIDSINSLFYIFVYKTVRMVIDKTYLASYIFLFSNNTLSRQFFGCIAEILSILSHLLKSLTGKWFNAKHDCSDLISYIHYRTIHFLTAWYLMTFLSFCLIYLTPQYYCSWNNNKTWIKTISYDNNY